MSRDNLIVPNMEDGVEITPNSEPGKIIAGTPAGTTPASATSSVSTIVTATESEA